MPSRESSVSPEWEAGKDREDTKPELAKRRSIRLAYFISLAEGSERSSSHSMGDAPCQCSNGTIPHLSMLLDLTIAVSCLDSLCALIAVRSMLAPLCHAGEMLL